VKILSRGFSSHAEKNLSKPGHIYLALQIVQGHLSVARRTSISPGALTEEELDLARTDLAKIDRFRVT